MKKIVLILSAILFTLSTATLVLYYYTHKPTPQNNTDSNTETPYIPPKPEEEILNKMTPKEKVGQLFIFGIEETTLTDEEKAFLKNNKIGGIILYGRNIQSEKQLKRLIMEIQSLNDIPLFISIDQEGGVVSRINWNPVLTGAQYSIKDANQAYTIAKARGEYLRSIGINMNFAPMAEYITSKDSFLYDRAFRGTETQVIQKTTAMVKGYSDSNEIAVIKHFPGHGNSAPDSHYSLPIVNIKNSKWDEYIQPFSEVLQQTNVDGVMVGHIQFPNIDNVPASLSYEIITNRLKKNLNYEGLVISDDMEMGALNDLATSEELAEQALYAGIDILIYNSNTSDIQTTVYTYILDEVEKGILDIDDKVLNILREKIKYGILVP